MFASPEHSSPSNFDLDVANAPQINYTVEFNRTGTHYVWVRGWGPDTAGDSVNIGLDGQLSPNAGRIGDFPLLAWSWVNFTRDGVIATINVPTTGRHTLNAWVRENGFKLDKIVLTKSSTYIPSGSGPAETVTPPQDPTPTPTPTSVPTSTPTPTPTPQPTATPTPTPQPTATPTPKPTASADINGDNVVDVLDLSILLSDWGTTGSDADLNNDGTVNIFDLSIMLSDWN